MWQLPYNPEKARINQVEGNNKSQEADLSEIKMPQAILLYFFVSQEHLKS